MRRGHRVDASLQRELVQQPAAAACQKGRGGLPVAHLRAQMPGVRIKSCVLVLYNEGYANTELLPVQNT